MASERKRALTRAKTAWTGLLPRGVCAGVLMLLAVLAAPVDAVRADDRQTLNYRDADIRAFIDDVSMLTSRTFIVDPQVKGQVTVISHTQMDADNLFDVFLATLRVNGYSVSSMPGGAYKILPSKSAVEDAALEGQTTAGDRFVTEVFKLDHVDGGTAVNMLKPLVNSDGRVVGNRASDFVVVVDYASNMGRVRQVIADIDRDMSVFRSVQLKNTSAAEMKRIIESLKEGGDDGGRRSAVTAVAIDATNTLVLRGDGRAVARMAAFVAEVDSKEVDRGNGVEVVTLKYASAEELAPMLQKVSTNLIQAEKAEGKSTVPADAKVLIAAHKSTNSIVIQGDGQIRENLKFVIGQLDTAREQVLVEGIIVEVSDQAAKELGLQYLLSGNGDSKIPFTATNFSNTAPNILAATGALIAPNEIGDSNEQLVSTLQQAALDSLLGVTGFVGGVAGQSADGTIFGVILNALQEDRDSNVLSTPSITTLDNEQASLIVGQEIPITTGEVVGQNFENPFRTVERQDVGIQLEVTPQITKGEGGARKSIKLSIRQTASSILGPVTASSQDLILNKRELTTNVMVDDGEIIVLGGLIEDDEQISVEQVPLLGDIPVLGRLFRSEGKSRRRTNLMVFLRPTIVTNRRERSQTTEHKFDLIRAQQEAFGASESATLDYFTTNVVGGDVPGLRTRTDPDTP